MPGQPGSDASFAPGKSFRLAKTSKIVASRPRTSPLSGRFFQVKIILSFRHAPCVDDWPKGITSRRSLQTGDLHETRISVSRRARRAVSRGIRRAKTNRTARVTTRACTASRRMTRVARSARAISSTIRADSAIWVTGTRRAIRRTIRAAGARAAWVTSRRIWAGPSRLDRAISDQRSQDNRQGQGSKSDEKEESGRSRQSEPRR